MPPRTIPIADPESVGAAVTRRRHRLQRTQLDMQSAGISKSVLSLIENGRQDRYQERVLSALRLALKWPVDWLERIGSGEDLTDYQAPQHAVENPIIRGYINTTMGDLHMHRDVLRDLLAATPDMTPAQIEDLLPRLQLFTRIVETQAQAMALLMEADHRTVNQLDVAPTASQLEAVVRRLARDVERLKDVDAARVATPTDQSSGQADQLSR